MRQAALPSNNRDTTPRRTPEGFYEYDGDKQFATTLARGLQLLRCFTPDQPLQGNKDLAQRLGLPKATISRLTYTLVQLGYLRNDRRLGKYELAPAVLSLSYPMLASLTLRQIARPAMKQFSDYAGGSVSLAIRDRLRVVYIETSRSNSIFSRNLSDIGMSYPIIQTATGHAYLAGCTPTERQELLNKIKLKQPDLWGMHSERLNRSLDMIGRRGFAISLGEARPEIHAVAVPFRRTTAGELTVINCVMHVSQLRDGQLEEEIGPRMVSMLKSLPTV